MRKSYLIGGFVAVLGVSACGDSLAVVNKNNPDIDRAYSTPAGVEGVIAGLGVQLYNHQRQNEGVNTQSKILSGESFTSVNNFGGAPRAALPRVPISNSLGNDIQAGNREHYYDMSSAARGAANVVRALENLIVELGPDALGSAEATNRARAFGYFVLGQALANLSYAYDSSAWVSPAIPSDSITPLSGYAEVNAKAVEMLDSAFVSASAGMEPLDATWLSSAAPVPQAEFVRIIRSIRARVRAGAARSPAERAAVNWALVIADAENGLTSDFETTVGGSTGWTGGYHVIQSYVPGGWHSAPMYYYGMADTSGRYSTWLATPRDSRTAFLVETPDARWPVGATRAVQTAESPTSVAIPAPRYMRNRPPSEDVPITGWGLSYYDHRRWGFIRVASNSGVLVEMGRAESDLLAAEGYIRANNFAAAAALIDRTRTANGLPALTGVIVDATTPVPGGTACVPQVPQAPNFTSAGCGTIWEAMKYEKRMETAFTGYMQWFNDNRGWGDMIVDTALEWPVPYQEMQARVKPFYDGQLQAPAGTYQFGVGDK